jgi:hypothetical protein
MTIVVPVPIAELSPAPFIGDPDFDAHADAHVAALTPHRLQVNASAEATYQNALDAHASAVSAGGAANAAAASQAQTAIFATTAAAAVGAEMWRSHQMVYTFGALVWSPDNGMLYRCRVPMSMGDNPITSPDIWWLIGAPFAAPIVQVWADMAAQVGMHYVFRAPALLTLPASPAPRDIVQVTDLSQSRNARIDPQGKKIRGQTGVMRLEMLRARFSLIYLDEEEGWF